MEQGPQGLLGIVKEGLFALFYTVRTAVAAESLGQGTHLADLPERSSPCTQTLEVHHYLESLITKSSRLARSVW